MSAIPNPEAAAITEVESALLTSKVRAMAPNLGKVSLAKRILRPQSYLNALAALKDVPKWKKIEKHLAEYTECNGSFFFVQIGANDGVGADPVREHVLNHNWKGLLVEPVPHVFEALKRNYQGHLGLDFANVAVTERQGTATMLAAVALPTGKRNPMSPMSSFDPLVVEKHRWMVDDLNGLVAPTDVKTTTLPGLFEQYGVGKIDGLFVDTEGHDKIVLDQLNMETNAPHFIMYEHAHLSATRQIQLTDRFSDYGYSVTNLRRDTFAELPG